MWPIRSSYRSCLESTHSSLNCRLPKLFDDRVGWTRNGATHDYLSYNVQTDTFLFRDGDGNSIPIHTGELLVLTEDMYQLAAETVARVGQLYMFREVFRNMGLREVFLDHIPAIAFEKNPQKALDLEEKNAKGFGDKA